MRLIVFVLVSGGSAVTQSWREHSYTRQFFTVAFASDLQMATTSYRLAEDRPVEARVYSIHQDDALFNMTVAEVADTSQEESAVIKLAIKMMSDDRLQRRYFNIDDAIRDTEQGSPAE
jgi:hypothetical protein